MLVIQKEKIKKPDSCFLKELLEVLGLLIKTREKCQVAAEGLPASHQPTGARVLCSASPGKASWISQPWRLTSPPDCQGSDPPGLPSKALAIFVSNSTLPTGEYQCLLRVP